MPNGLGSSENSSEGYKNSYSIGFDAKRAFSNNSGLGNYSRNLLYALEKNFPGNSYFLFTPDTGKKIIIENENRFNIVRPESFISRSMPSLWRRRFMINDMKRNKLDLFHGLSQELPVDIESTGIKSLVTVHDLIFIRYPDYYKKIDAKIYKWKLINACRSADHIVAVSAQTKKDLISFLNIPEDKISVILQGCSPGFSLRCDNEAFSEIKIKYNLPQKYLLYVGTIEPRKNLLGLIKARHIKNIDLPLVVIGRKSNRYYKKVMQYITDNHIKNIIFPERISNHDLPALYQYAECFIYPSYYEGFGIPVLEALVSGTPVITSKDGCFREAGGPGSIYIDPDNYEEIGEAILKVVNSTEDRNRMINLGSNYAKNFTEEIIAGNYMNLYHSLLQ